MASTQVTRKLPSILTNKSSFNTKLNKKHYSTTPAVNFREKLKTLSWQIHNYGDIKDVQLTTTRMPVIQRPKEVLIKVDAASVNPIDLMMCQGYGKTLINVLRSEMELPLTLGRDFCGTIISKGHAVDKKYKIGDQVYGFKPIHAQGSFSEAILAQEGHICHKPAKLTQIESTSLVYSTMTAWSALFVTGSLAFRNIKGLRVLILGASGGVGTSAIQLLKSQGCNVIATCAKDAIPLVKSVGADVVFDYTEPDFNKNIEMDGLYHIILDCAKYGHDNIPNEWTYDSYIALNSPLLINTDKYGLAQGLFVSANNLINANTKSFGRKFVKWGFFMPFENGFKFVNDLICTGKIKPTVHRVFKFADVPSAFETVSKGHLRGKVVIDFS